MKRQIENEGEYLHPKQLALNLSHAKTIESGVDLTQTTNDDKVM
jgi:hypothetical protein